MADVKNLESMALNLEELEQVNGGMGGAIYAFCKTCGQKKDSTELLLGECKTCRAQKLK